MDELARGILALVFAELGLIVIIGLLLGIDTFIRCFISESIICQKIRELKNNNNDKKIKKRVRLNENV